MTGGLESAEPTRWQKVCAIFEQCIELREPGRTDRVRELAGDPALAAEVLDLIESSERAETVLEPPTHGAVLKQLAADSAEPADALRAGDVIDDRYLIGAPIASGGMGVVFRAEQVEPVRRPVALKVIRAGMERGAILSRFEQERQALALMDHENIARILDAGSTSEGAPYFVMEFVDGVPITRYCDERRLSIPRRLALLEHVCDAVHHAHQKGVVHRDLKPHNVLVTEREGRPVPKVIDFGIARATGAAEFDAAAVTLTGQLLGTPAYMSPEQAAGSSDIDTRTDVYSLGVMLYEILTGALPFASNTALDGLFELQRRIREDEPSRPSARVTTVDAPAEVATRRGTTVSTLRRALRGDLDWIVMKALEKDRDRRYASASELAQDLARFRAGEPVIAGPPSRVYRLQKFVRRYRGAVAAAALALVALVSATVVSTASYFDARRNQQEAERSREDADRARRSEELRAYRANIAAATYALEASNHREARERLQACVPHLRGFEWRHLGARLEASDRAALRVLKGHTDSVMAVLPRPGTREVASASLDGTVRFWDRDTGEELRRDEPRKMPPASDRVHDGVIDIDISPDGRRVIAGYVTGRVVLRDIDRDVEVFARQRGSSVYGVRFSRDGSRVFVTSGQAEDGEVRIDTHDADSGDIVDSFGYPARRGSSRFVVSPDERWFVDGTHQRVRLWDREEGGVRELSIEGFGTSLDFDQSGGTLLICGYRQRVARLVDMATGQWKGVLQSASGSMNMARFGDDRHAFVGDEVGRVQVWDLARLSVERSLFGHANTITAMCYDDPTGELITGSDDSTVRIWAVAGVRAARHFSAVPRSVFRLSPRPGGGEFVVTSEGGHFQRFSLDGTIIADVEMPFRTWDHPETIASPFDWVIQATWHPTDPDRIAFASLPNGVDHHHSGRLTLWDTGAARRVDVDAGEQIWRMKYEPGGRSILTVGVFGTVQRFDAATGDLQQVVHRALPEDGDQTGIDVIAIDPTRATLLVVVAGRKLRFLDLDSGERTREVSIDGDRVDDALFLPDGSALYTIERDAVVVRDPVTAAVRQRLLGHQGRVWSLAITPDATRVITGGSDGTVRLWDVRDGENVAVLRGHDSDVREIISAEDASGAAWIVSGDLRGQVRVWRSALPESG